MSACMASSGAADDGTVLEALAREFLQGDDPLGLLSEDFPGLSTDSGLQFASPLAAPAQLVQMPLQAGLQPGSVGDQPSLQPAFQGFSQIEQQPNAACDGQQGFLASLAAPINSDDSRVGSGSLQQHSGIGTQPSSTQALKAEAQLQKMRETSRKAQRKYREKQRSKLMDAETRVAELTEELTQLRLEKQQLERPTARQELLERCLAMQSCQTATNAISIVEPGGDAWWMDDNLHMYLSSSPQLSGEFVFTVGPYAPLRTTREQVRDMPPEEVGHLWRHYLNAYAECLLEMNGDTSSRAAQRLERLTYESGQIWCLVLSCLVLSCLVLSCLVLSCLVLSLFLNHQQDYFSCRAAILIKYPAKLEEVMAHMSQDDAARGDPMRSTKHDQEDQRLTNEANFTWQQKQVLCGIWRRLHTNLGILQKRRENLTAELQAVMPQRSPGIGEEAARPAGDNTFVRTLAAIEALRNTLRDEHSTFLTATFLFWRKICTCLQEAHLSLQAYPAAVRIFAIMECVAMEAGEPTAAELLAAGAVNPDAPLQQLEDALPPAMRLEVVPPVAAGLAPEAAAAMGLT